MTDEDIKKGLGDCRDVPNCAECPYQHSKTCQDDLHHDALALINRLEEEKEQIRKETVKEMLQSFAQFRAVSPALSATWYTLAEKYGVTD